MTATPRVPVHNLAEELPFENDDPAQAQPMDYAQTYRGNLANRADTVDWIKFDGSAGDVLSIELFEPNCTLAPTGSAATWDLELTLVHLAAGTEIEQPAEN